MANKDPLIEFVDDGGRVELRSPVAVPDACAFLWNPALLLQLNCRGYALAQFMQPEPAKYSGGPVPEQKTFMLPEHKYYAHHPGRFVYLKIDDELFSVPHEPVRKTADEFVFSAGKADVEWRLKHGDILVRWAVSVPVDDTVELWTLEIQNSGATKHRISVYPCFSIGYKSWMNQSAEYRRDLGGVVASSVTPYQKLEDHESVLQLKDKTFLLHDVVPDAWETSQTAFEGEGGLQNPDGVRAAALGKSDACYETPLAALQYNIELARDESRTYRFVFGPAKDDEEIASLRSKHLARRGFAAASEDYQAFLDKGEGCIKISTPDQHFDDFVNHWLDRQIYYHGSANRFCTDPQTRNYLQDSMGMVYVAPEITRAVLCTALAQQKPDGAMPDGILLVPGSELKYINQVPHSDHSVWLPVCLQAYLAETGDDEFLDELISGRSVRDRVTDAVHTLLDNRDHRGLSLIAEGDWCDPMNMVGHKGRGVSSWLSMATVHAIKLWSDISRRTGDVELAEELSLVAGQMSVAIREHFWDEEWFARGITDNDQAFGISTDREGQIFLNPQSWSVIAGIADEAERNSLLAAVSEKLGTPFGAMILAPAYTAFRDDVGRLTQKSPGTTENGSIYNHASAFYVYALFLCGKTDEAFEQLRRSIPGPSGDDYRTRGQLPLFVPNCYRGAVHQFPRTAGRSSQLFNTGAASWLYRSVVEELFGLKGDNTGLRIEPRLPAGWSTASVTRRFRDAEFSVEYCRDAKAESVRISVDGESLEGRVIDNFVAGRSYEVEVVLPS